MGYDLHITRRTNWSDESGPSITEAEWRDVVDVDLLGALRYDAGAISAKNPTPSLIRKMVHVARQLGAQVQGDDGELYREDATSFQPETTPPAPETPDILSRIGGWWRRRRISDELRQAAPRFQVGQRVKDQWGKMATVISCDLKANHGLGSVRIRMDDGREQHVSYVASGLEIVADPAGGE